MTHFVIQLHFNDGFANGGHCGPEINVRRLVHQPAAVFFGAGEAGEVFPIVQLLVQLFIAGPGLLHHAHGQPVLVQVVVKRHRKHDGHALGADAALHVEQVVGQQADGARGGVVVLGEGAHFSPGRADGGLGRVVAEAARHVDPVEETGRLTFPIDTGRT